MPKVNIVGWREGLLKISMTQVLHERLPLGVRDAKGCVDDVLDGKDVSFDVGDRAEAEALSNALTEIGAIVEVEGD
jgi:ribosomal protein L7/L12